MAWLLRKWAWAKKNPLFWANFLLVVISVLLILKPGPALASGHSDLCLRIWAMLLQLIGILTVWFDLTSTARMFNKDKASFLSNTLVWLKSFFDQSVVIMTVTGTAGLPRLRARRKERQPLQPNAPLPDRVATLEINVKKIDEDLDAAYQEIDKRADELNARIAAESRQRDRAIREVNTSLEGVATGNFATLVFGVVWLAIGVMLATLAPEIVKIVGG